MVLEKTLILCFYIWPNINVWPSIKIEATRIWNEFAISLHQPQNTTKHHWSTAILYTGDRGLLWFWLYLTTTYNANCSSDDASWMSGTAFCEIFSERSYSAFFQQLIYVEVVFLTVDFETWKPQESTELCKTKICHLGALLPSFTNLLSVHTWVQFWFQTCEPFCYDPDFKGFISITWFIQVNRIAVSFVLKVLWFSSR